MKRLFAVLTVVLLSGGLHANAAETAKRIQFEKGKSSAVVQGVTGQYGITYVVRARGGQKLILDLASSAKVGIKVETKGSYGHMVLLEEQKAGSYQVGLEENGDYTIFVGSPKHTSDPFTLTVKIGTLTDI